MPRFDRTGPLGYGPGTGRGLGSCLNGQPQASFWRRPIGWFRGWMGWGRGFGRGRGMRRGFGRGFGFRRGI